MNSTVDAFGRDGVVNILGGSGNSVRLGSGNKAVLTSESLSSVSITSKTFSTSGDYAKISLLGTGNTVDVSGLKRGTIITSALKSNTIIGNSDNRISVLIQALSTQKTPYSSVENFGYTFAPVQPKSYLAISAA